MPHQFNNSLTAERLRYLFDYEPKSGIFRRKVSHRNDLIGAQAGCKNKQGYVVIRVDGVLHRASRLAWLYCNGCWPSELIDHADGRRDNDAIANLREATSRENNANKRYYGSACGFKGIYRNRRGRYVARLMIGRHYVHLGTYATPADAAYAYNLGAIRHFGNFARLNQV
jgi:hypothetical protein